VIVETVHWPCNPALSAHSFDDHRDAAQAGNVHPSTR
jgi:hypothetical protein